MAAPRWRPRGPPHHGEAVATGVLLAGHRRAPAPGPGGRRDRRVAAWGGGRRAAAGRAGAERSGPSGAATPSAAAPEPEVRDRKDRPLSASFVSCLPPPSPQTSATGSRATTPCASARAPTRRPAPRARTRARPTAGCGPVAVPGRMRRAGAGGRDTCVGGATTLSASTAHAQINRRDISHRLLRESAACGLTAPAQELGGAVGCVAHAHRLPAPDRGGCGACALSVSSRRQL